MVNKNTKVTYGISTGNHAFSDNGAAEDENDILSDIAKVDYNFGGGDWTLSVGRTDKYVIGGSKGYGYNYGDIFDRAELKYSGDSFMATAGYGKFKAGGVAGLAADSLRTVLPEALTAPRRLTASSKAASATARLSAVTTTPSTTMTTTLWYAVRNLITSGVLMQASTSAKTGTSSVTTNASTTTAISPPLKFAVTKIRLPFGSAA